VVRNLCANGISTGNGAQVNRSTTEKIIKGAALAGGALILKSILRKALEFDLTGKTVLITGGSRGLGLVLARAFAEQGARIVVCARDVDELKRAENDLRSRGVDVLAVECDVTNRAQVDEMMFAIQDFSGGVDVLVNNAGSIQMGPVDVMTREDFAQVMNVHFWGPLNTMLAALPHMRRKRAGRIVNISSIGGKIGVPHLVPYCASKFALVGLSEGMRSELWREGIKVTTVCPGLMRTGSPRNADFKGKHRAEYAWFSIGDALPITSIKAERAAHQIVRACQRGQAELIISVQAKAAALFHSLFPEVTTDLLAIANELLPKAGGIGTGKAKGRDSTSSISPSWLTRLNERAALKNNEMSPVR
jgi:NAD(P)-dependent dehydrogenase (short-subunit alcohol dehydrogenase family)